MGIRLQGLAKYTSNKSFSVSYTIKLYVRTRADSVYLAEEITRILPAHLDTAMVSRFEACLRQHRVCLYSMTSAWV